MDTERSERRPLVRRNRNSVNLSGIMKEIDRNKEKVNEAIDPQTFSGRLRLEIVRKIPIASIRNALEKAPIDYSIDKLRPHVNTLYNNMGPILRETRDVSEQHEEIRQMLDDVKDNPDDHSLVVELADKFRQEAERNVGVNRDSDTEELLGELLNPDDPEKKLQIRERIILQAEDLLETYETLADAAEVIGRNTGMAYLTIDSEYAKLLRTRQLVSILHKAGGDLAMAHDSRIESVRTMFGQVDILLSTAALTSRIQEITDLAASTTDKDERHRLRLQAGALRDQVLNTFAVTSGEKKALPKKAVEDKKIEGDGEES